jgi:uncharacterized membrane protein YoaK (UPF0700 family)
MTSVAATWKSGLFVTIGLYSFTGGYADASGYLLSRSFTGHVTGNLVLFAIAIASWDVSVILRTLLAVLTFLAATSLGQILLRRSKGDPGISLVALITILQCALVAAAPLFLLHSGQHGVLAMIVCLCSALGLQNGFIRSAHGVNVHTTYLTGTLTSLLEASTDPNPNLKSSTHKDPHLRRSIRTGLTVWASFMIGAFAAAVLVHRSGAYALLVMECPIIISCIICIAQRRQQVISST